MKGIVLSFLEHDFRECFISTKGQVIEEEVVLSIHNNSNSAITIRPFDKKKTRIFRLESDFFFNDNIGCGTTLINGKKALIIESNQTAQAKIVFSPIDSDRQYTSNIDLLIDEKDIVSIRVRGIGQII